MSSTRASRIGTIVTLLIIGLILIGLSLPAVNMNPQDRPKTAAKQNLKQFGLAMHNYLAANGAFPAQAIRNADGKALLSWRVALLPYFEVGEGEESLYRQFYLDEPWNSAHNLPLLAKMPAVFSNPAAPEPGRTIYVGVVGDKTVFGGASGATPLEMTDGLSNTIMLVEADYAVPWTKPEDLDYDPQIPMNGLGHAHPSGFIALFSDGSVRFILDNTKTDVLQALMTMNGGEAVTLP